MNTDAWLYVGIGAGLASIVASLLYFRWVVRQDAGSETARPIARWIAEGASTYLRMRCRTLTVVAILVGFILAYVYAHDPSRPYHGIYSALAYAVGALCSTLAGWLGMTV